MSEKSFIPWCDGTWNIATGCKKVDEDCKFCYMYRYSLNETRYDPKAITRTKGVFKMPLKYKETQSEVWPGRPLIFTCSLTDFFIEEIDPFRQEAWDIIRKCPHLIFQILTKRPERIKDCLPPDWGHGWGNVWLGTSVGSQKSIHRMEQLALFETDCIKFLSLEPLHGPINLNYKHVQILHPDNDGHGVEILKAFDWVITGGESGNENGKYQYRPCELSWIEDIVEACKDAGVPVFVKQLGTYLSKQMGLESRHGTEVHEFPAHLQLREFPTKESLFTRFGSYAEEYAR